ncbi:sigma 54-interacting transcriptional regulator [Ferrimonas lipolytica]|uniref:Sigma 54-interacting transcriptional regulator n=1 Tax=Ferrimonas lipolytica TaxID=2724191 RepID=A0A6H1UD11_9GAMM|nr:sigma 54-interacting transcriptional regulator [Ferrimonas lipolytica]QIZ76243.1 sigma 54-interacting transcriptional regulator [Ferrimonas lipolytica]
MIEFYINDVKQVEGNILDYLNGIAAICSTALEKVLVQTGSQYLLPPSNNSAFLVDVTNAVIDKDKLNDLARSLSVCLNNYLTIQSCSLMSLEQASERLRCFDFEMGLGSESKCQAHYTELRKSLYQQVIQQRQPLVLNHAELGLLNKCHSCEKQLSAGMLQACIVPLSFRDKVVGVMRCEHRQADFFGADVVSLLEQVAARVSMGVNAIQLNQQSKMLAASQEVVPVIEEPGTKSKVFEEIISKSEVMDKVLQQVLMVADSDCTVLICGETGTGKEVVAQAIHRLSGRSAKPMVTMNCSAIPAGLFESDLFGHEKGAFTGALNQRIGRFEHANQGTLFLDEIGDMPLELQPKLLRVLQESEIERVGRHQPIPVDVRLVAATNFDLRQQVEKKTFRSDLFYRLNVVPIQLPPLRERREDIPLLAKHFTRLYAKKMNRNITSIPAEILRLLALLDWPGNVRELSNVIERAVVLTRGNVLNLPVAELQALAELESGHMLELEPLAAEPQPQPQSQPTPASQPSGSQPQTTEATNRTEQPSLERDRIVQILKETNGIVAGPRGAANRLGLKRTTLLSRMQRLGISTKTFIR